MAITLTEATAQVDAWQAASLAVAKGQSYTIGDRTLTRAHASEVRNMIRYWTEQEAQLQRIANGQGRISFALADFNS